MDISGKVGLVTGGADGIGKVLVENLLQKGAKGVTIIDFDESKGIETLKELKEKFAKDRVIFCKADVSSKDELEAAFKKTLDTFGALNIVCNNAGIADEVEWETMFRINLNGTIYGTLLALEYMNDAESGGVVIQISSAAAMMSPIFVPLYSVSKEASNGFSRNIALHDPTAQKKRIRVNIVCPMKVDKPMSKHGRFATEEGLAKVQAMNDDPERRAAMAVVICSMQDVANAMLMLIEGDHNGKTAVVLSGMYRIVDDYHQRMRQDVLKIVEEQSKKRTESSAAATK